MIAAMFRGLGQFALLLVSMALLVVMSLFVIGSFLLTWPLHRLSPRDKRLRASVGFASSGMTLLTAYSDGSIRKMMETATEDDEPPVQAEPSPNIEVFLHWARSLAETGEPIGEDAERGLVELEQMLEPVDA